MKNGSFFSVRRIGLLCVFLIGGIGEAMAQRPFQSNDVLYRSETARRAFFDGYAISAEVSYRTTAGLPATNNVAGAHLLNQIATTPLSAATFAAAEPTPTILTEAAALSANSVGLSFQFDYALGPNLDLSAIVHASQDQSGSSNAQLSWFAFKYYRHASGNDYAIRFAFDPNPAPDGRVGMRQADLAFVMTSNHTPLFSTDFAVGFRRVDLDYAALSPADSRATADGLALTQAEGWEGHLMMSVRRTIDPAQSHIFTSLLLEGGAYDLADVLWHNQGRDPIEAQAAQFRGAVVWLRFGAQRNRPQYQIAPFFNIPLLTWTQDDRTDVGVTQKGIQLGARFTLR